MVGSVGSQVSGCHRGLGLQAEVLLFRASGSGRRPGDHPYAGRGWTDLQSETWNL